ncbi:nicotinate mononucleotide-dependent phosphoribosyltransferase CobT [Salinilacihabitans rarus]|uniref:nicotinate mononucleotide-dependent phosphoribosyltransferase CobT n=1 Tax=Salinilacihabitans rarus TaxID=2961596 RepID=UPI0020C8D084|nr:TIGR00303 family protein [Salinilacihabitans rarus]
MRVILAAGTTETALIDGISAAGAAPALTGHTPAADAEILVYGEPTAAPVTPVSPTGCPTPAAITRAVREVVGFDATVLDAGLSEPTAAPTVDLDAAPGRDVREPAAVPGAATIFERARAFGAGLPDDEVLVGETIPGGTTTALGVLAALGEPTGVSSSLPENPLERKRRIVAEGLAASGVDRGDCADEPFEAVRLMGDPVQTAVAGVAAGALAAGTDVTLAGGTQLVAVAALLRRAGVDAPLRLATTSFVAADRGRDLEAACERLDCDLVVTDPDFDASDHVAMARYRAGEAKEGVAMGGALSLVPAWAMPTVRTRIETVCERLGVAEAVADAAGGEPRGP